MGIRRLASAGLTLALLMVAAARVFGSGLIDHGGTARQQAGLDDRIRQQR